MCVHVHLTTGMPGGVLTWVDRQAAHTQVYADTTLARGGVLTAAGRTVVDKALSAATGQTLATARPCLRRLAS